MKKNITSVNQQSLQEWNSTHLYQKTIKLCIWDSALQKLPLTNFHYPSYASSKVSLFFLKQHKAFIDGREMKFVFPFICLPQLHTLALCPRKTNIMKNFTETPAAQKIMEFISLATTMNSSYNVLQVGDIPPMTVFLRGQKRQKICLIRHIFCLTGKQTKKRKLEKKNQFCQVVCSNWQFSDRKTTILLHKILTDVIISNSHNLSRGHLSICRYTYLQLQNTQEHLYVKTKT